MRHRQRRLQMLKLEGSSAEGLEGSMGSAAGGLSAWLASASVGDDGELASIAGTATTARTGTAPVAAHVCKPVCRGRQKQPH